jgi:hypothetical protein
VAVTYTFPNVGVRQLFQAQLDSLNAGECSVACFTSPSSISDGTSLAALGLFTASGFAEQQTTFTAAALDATGTNATAASETSTFALTATVPPVTIAGVVYTYKDLAGANELIGVVLLPNGPLIISQVGDNVVAQLTITDSRAAGQP